MDYNQRLSDYLDSGDIVGAALIIETYPDHVSFRLVKHFYSNCFEKGRGQYLVEIAQVFDSTKILPSPEEISLFSEELSKQSKSEKFLENVWDATILIFYRMTLKAENILSFLEIYESTEVDPPVDFIYLSLMLARTGKKRSLMCEIERVFNIACAC